MTASDTAVSRLSAEVYKVPTDRPEADGTLAWDSTVMVLARASVGPVEGIGWTYAAGAAKSVVDDHLAPVIEGRDALDTTRLHESMVRACRNLGRAGLVSCAISAVDIAMWDLKARLFGTTVTNLIGRARDDAPVYGSGGFTTYDDATTTAQLHGWVAKQEIPRVKIKIAESWGTCPERDVHRVELTREVVGRDVDVYVDANGGYSQKQAVRMGHRLSDHYGVTWFEEPVSSDDLDGLREVRDQCRADVAAGEYGYTPHYFARMIAAGAVDCIQADVTRCGGYTGWLTVARLAAAHNLQISGHCAPNLHLPVAVGVPNLRHLEYFHDHVRIETLLFDGTRPPVRGALVPAVDAMGIGLTLREADADPYRSG
jgi:L-alanine-DL-glutamate epimerase-like enolase superfamily enzyme